MKFELGVGEIKRHIVEAWKDATGMVRHTKKKKAEGENGAEGDGKKARVATAAEA